MALSAVNQNDDLVTIINIILLKNGSYGCFSISILGFKDVFFACLSAQENMKSG